MLDLNDFFYFVQVVDRGGFTAASRTLRLPKSTLSHRIRQLEAGLGVRLLNRTSRRFGMTDAGGEFYRHAAEMLQQAEQAEASIRHRLSEPIGTVRFTSGTATMQFALREAVTDFLVRHPRVNVVAHATDQKVDIVGENYDVAVRAHADPLPNSTLVQRTLAPAPWLLFAGAAYLDANGSPRQRAKKRGCRAPDAAPHERRHGRIEARGDRRARHCRAARLCLSRRASIGSPAPGVAHVACRRFDADGAAALPARPVAFGPRLH